MLAYSKAQAHKVWTWDDIQCHDLHTEFPEVTLTYTIYKSGLKINKTP
jgi:hypothetical protein